MVILNISVMIVGQLASLLDRCLEVVNVGKSAMVKLEQRGKG
jgi:hypothetical protein